MTAYVYLLAHATEPRVKIGRSNNPKRRIGDLGEGQFELSLSKIYRVESQAIARQLEHLLHQVFATFRLSRTDVNGGDDSVRQDGDTEWFHFHCMHQAVLVLDFMCSNEVRAETDGQMRKLGGCRRTDAEIRSEELKRIDASQVEMNLRTVRAEARRRALGNNK